MIEKFEGKVWKFGPEIDTDIICPMSATKIPDIEIMKMLTMDPIRPGWAPMVKPGDIIVAGENFGCGSSREMAPQMIAALGIKVVIAPSFGRIFFRNAINNGLLCIESVNVTDNCEEGDILTVEINRCIRVRGKEFSCPSIPDNLLSIVEAGGLVPLQKVNNVGKPETKFKHTEYTTKNPPKCKNGLEGYTIVEKILMRNAHLDHLKPGDIVITHPDVVNIHEMNTPYVVKLFDDMGFKKAWDPEKIVLYNDHVCPTGTSADSHYYHSNFELARKLGLRHLHVGEGVAHSLFPEQGYTKPGMVIFATDSHTVSYGGGSAFATGIGYTEMTAILGTGELWAKVPTAIKVEVSGKLRKGVYAKDIVLKLLGDLKATGGNYRSIEFCGEAIHSLSILERHTLCNMVVEIGAKSGIVEADEKTADFFKVPIEDIKWIKAGADSEYERVIRYAAEDIEPVLSCPPLVDNVHPLKEVEGTRLTQVFFGSCTNANIEDIEEFSNIVKGKKFPQRMKVIVVPATLETYKTAMRKGWLQDIIRAGGIVSHPCCALCLGRCCGLMSDTEVMLGTNSRNFLGRFGAKGAKVYQGSPATAAASALTGVITDPRNY